MQQRMRRAGQASYLRHEATGQPWSVDRKSVRGLGGFGFGLEEFGKLFDFLGLFDDVERENVGGGGFLEFVAEGGGELVEALDAFAEFLFVFE